MTDPLSGEAVAERLTLPTALRPGSLALAPFRPVAQLPLAGQPVRRLVNAPVPTNVHRLGPVIAAGAMITPQDVARLRAPVEDGTS